MKTRQELILDFMVALAGNGDFTSEYEEPKHTADDVYRHAVALADKYLGSLT